jgi:ATP-dependent helicase/nuclease subunit A
MTPSDVAILFRTRDSHREYEEALERRGIGAYVYKGLGFFDADEIKDVLALLWYLADPLSDMRAAALLRSRFARISDDGLRRLAPHIAAAIGGLPTVAAELDAEDAATLRRLRDASARWRDLVDRVPPAELLDLVLADSAYFVEMRGPRWPQARENLKKIRALIRRIQNRGYATLGRIAAHLDRLAVGDESNAVIDAMDAVNLMTVHAAKGLEFPVVFAVNLARGTGGFRDPIRVVAGAGDGDVSVAVGDFRSDADEDAAAREAEESKRLLYVALTRARDRLYLGSVLKDGTLQPGRGSLAAVLPQTLIDQFAAAGEVVEWRASSGDVHRFRCLRDSEIANRDSSPIKPRTNESRIPIPDPGVEPLNDFAAARVSVASVVSTETERGAVQPRR